MITYTSAVPLDLVEAPVSDAEQPTDAERIAALEARVAELEKELQEQAGAFRYLAQSVLGLKHHVDTVPDTVSEIIPQLIREHIAKPFADMRALGEQWQKDQEALTNQRIAIAAAVLEEALYQRLRRYSIAEVLDEAERREGSGRVNLRALAEEFGVNYETLRTMRARRKRKARSVN